MALTSPDDTRRRTVELGSLASDRRRFAVAPHDGGRPAGADERAVERLLLASLSCR